MIGRGAATAEQPAVRRAEDERPLDVLVRPGWIRERYRQFVVVANDLQVDLSGIDPETLVVTTDWLAWRRLSGRGVHALHVESALEHWPGEPAPPLDHLVRATEWMYVDGADATAFRNVSLGKLFNWEVAASHHAAFRVFHGLDRLATEFRPQRIVFVDLRGEYDFVPDEAKRSLVRAVADKYGAAYAERPCAESADERFYPHLRFDMETPPPPRLKRMLVAIYEACVQTLCDAHDALRGKRSRVFILQNPLLSDSLLKSAPPTAQPAVLARYNPKSRRFVSSCLKSGVVLARLPWAWLTGADRRVLRKIRATFADAWKTAASDPVDEATRLFIRRHVLREGILERKALESKRFAALLRRMKPDRMLIGDSENGTGRLLLEIGQHLRIPVDELPNGVFLGCQSVDSRCGDCARGPLISRFLSWGVHAESWLRQVGSPVEVSRVGYPVVDILRRRPPLPRRAGTRNALVLPLHVERLDVRGIESKVFSTLVETVRVLQGKGFQVRIKAHPGYHDLRYYDDLVRESGLNADVVKTGTVLDHLAWADVVVGPVSSNAFIETLAMGRAYVPMVLYPSATDARLVRPIPVAETIEQMAALVDREGIDREEALRILTDYDPANPAGARIWSAMQANP